MRVPFLVVAIAWFATMAGANLATPLYAVYEREFGFSSAVLTVVFATYMIVLAPSLLVFGQLSDRFGRRRVMAAGFATATLGLVTFAAAQSLPWLFAARSLQGVAVGMVAGAAAAALVELDPAPQEERAALFTSLAQAGGSGSGPVIAGMLAEWAPAPPRPPVRPVRASSASRQPSPPSPSPNPAERVPATGPFRLVRPSVPAEIRTLFSAREPDRGGGVGRGFDVPVRGAVVRGRPARHGKPGAAGRGRAGRCWRRRAQRRSRCASAPPAHARDQAVGLLLLAVGLVALVLAFPANSLRVADPGRRAQRRGPRARDPRRAGADQPRRAA